MNEVLWPHQAELFRSWLETLGLTQKSGAERLGIRPRDMRYYCAGHKPAPPAVTLALQHLVLVNGVRK